MKVLLCTPYLKEPGIFRGGINIWADNVISYRNRIESDVELLPVSFDRRNYVSVDSGLYKEAAEAGEAGFVGKIVEKVNYTNSVSYRILVVSTGV